MANFLRCLAFRPRNDRAAKARAGVTGCRYTDETARVLRHPGGFFYLRRISEMVDVAWLPRSR